jgi:hypothetical protein
MILVDSDHITYRSAASCEPTKAKPFLEDEQYAIARAKILIESVYARFPTEPVRWAIGGEGNWRLSIYPEYKLNRAGKPRPTHLQAVRELLVTQCKAEIVNDKEVDDWCGIEQTANNEAGEHSVIVSLDKDLDQIPGWHYNFVTGRYYLVSPLDALRTFYKQVITGDASDHVPAFDGKFRNSLPQFVAKMLAPIDTMVDEEDMYHHCWTIFQEQDPEDPYEKLHRNAKILYVQRKEGDMWQPPGPKEENEPSL